MSGALLTTYKLRLFNPLFAKYPENTYFRYCWLMLGRQARDNTVDILRVSGISIRESKTEFGSLLYRNRSSRVCRAVKLYYCNRLSSR